MRSGRAVCPAGGPSPGYPYLFPKTEARAGNKLFKKKDPSHSNHPDGMLKFWEEKPLSVPPAQMVTEPIGTPRLPGICTPLMLETWIDCVDTDFEITVPTGLGAVGGYVWIHTSLGDVAGFAHTVIVEKNCAVPAREPEFCP